MPKFQVESLPHPQSNWIGQQRGGQGMDRPMNQAGSQGSQGSHSRPEDGQTHEYESNASGNGLRRRKPPISLEQYKYLPQFTMHRSVKNLAQNPEEPPISGEKNWDNKLIPDAQLNEFREFDQQKAANAWEIVHPSVHMSQTKKCQKYIVDTYLNNVSAYKAAAFFGTEESKRLIKNLIMAECSTENYIESFFRTKSTCNISEICITPPMQDTSNSPDLNFIKFRPHIYKITGYDTFQLQQPFKRALLTIVLRVVRLFLSTQILTAEELDRSVIRPHCFINNIEYVGLDRILDDLNALIFEDSNGFIRERQVGLLNSIPSLSFLYDDVEKYTDELFSITHFCELEKQFSYIHYHYNKIAPEKREKFLNLPVENYKVKDTMYMLTLNDLLTPEYALDFANYRDPFRLYAIYCVGGNTEGIPAKELIKRVRDLPFTEQLMLSDSEMTRLIYYHPEMFCIKHEEKLTVVRNRRVEEFKILRSLLRVAKTAFGDRTFTLRKLLAEARTSKHSTFELGKIFRKGVSVVIEYWEALRLNLPKKPSAVEGGHGSVTEGGHGSVKNPVKILRPINIAKHVNATIGASEEADVNDDFIASMRDLMAIFNKD